MNSDPVFWTCRSCNHLHHWILMFTFATVPTIVVVLCIDYLHWYTPATTYFNGLPCKEWTTRLCCSKPIHIERKQTQKQKFSLMFVVFFFNLFTFKGHLLSFGMNQTLPISVHKPNIVSYTTSSRLEIYTGVFFPFVHSSLYDILISRTYKWKNKFNLE